MADTFWRDLRYGARMLAKSPGFTLAAVFSLALGIGANTTIFSLVNFLLLRPLPVERPSEIAAVFTSDFSGPRYGTSSYPDYVDWRDRNDVFSGLVAYQVTPFSLNTREVSDRLFGEVVSGNYFSVLGIPLERGRGFLPEEDRTPGTHPVVVVSHGLWQRKFGGDRSLLGSALLLNGQAFTVVGIAREGYSGLTRGFAVDLWVPMMMQGRALPGSNDLANRGDRSTFVLGRLKPGATLAQAQEQFNVLARQLHQAYPDNWTDVRSQPRVVTVVPESGARIFPAVRGPLLGFLGLLMVVVGLVLLTACANVANLLLARATVRRKEIAIRLALGAGRARLVRQLVTESAVLALLAAGVGLLLAQWGTELLMAFQPPVPVPLALDLSLDWRVLLFTLGMALLTGLLFGLAPALTASRPELVTVLKDESAAAAGGGKSRLRNVFVVAQVTLSLLLLIGGGLFLRSLQNATAIDPGFDPENALVAAVDLQIQGYGEPAGLAFYRQALERLRGLPGVRAASFATQLPLGLESARRGITIEGYTRQPGEDMEVHSSIVGPDYFETLGIPILRGRGITSRDLAGAPGVVVINQAFAQRYWPGQEPIGRKIQMGVSNVNSSTPYWEVVGVAKDGKYVTLGEDARPFFYLPLLQAYRSSASLVVRTQGDPRALLPAVRSEIEALDKTLPLLNVRTMTQHMSVSLLPARLAGSVLGTFGAVALLLAALGLYGVMAYSVAQRTREIGIRIALGAGPREILRLVVGRGMTLTAVGAALGLAGAVAVTRFLSGLLYGISPTDPATFVGNTLLLGGVALLACYLPARRATRVDPMVALRYE